MFDMVLNTPLLIIKFVSYIGLTLVTFSKLPIVL